MIIFMLNFDIIDNSCQFFVLRYVLKNQMLNFDENNVYKYISNIYNFKYSLKSIIFIYYIGLKSFFQNQIILYHATNFQKYKNTKKHFYYIFKISLFKYNFFLDYQTDSSS
ncbi:hypothetical protein SLOPH_938 [Spraguea lophii 42_110]|uniref:Uncharacterized protein n=1 Tax=Spraguea lophii (strain 42_110) TaxID=1358809 RepID=S7XST1_SPRLO|nr:hypothetical protein SLOPH_938 [Spraguea lophii 42_110]